MAARETGPWALVDAGKSRYVLTVSTGLWQQIKNDCAEGEPVLRPFANSGTQR